MKTIQDMNIEYGFKPLQILTLTAPAGVMAKRFLPSFPTRRMNKTVFAATTLDGFRWALGS